MLVTAGHGAWLPALPWRRGLQPQFLLHLAADFLGFQPVVAGPNRSATHQTDAVPDDMKMLPPVLDVFDDHALVMKHLVAVFFLAAFNDGENLLIGQMFAFHWIDADMVQRLGASGATSDFPHFLEGLIQILGFRVAQLYKARFLVLALLFHIFGSRSVAAPDVRFDNQ